MTLAVDVARRVVVASNEGVAVVARHLSATDVNRVSPHHLGVVPTRLARDAAVAVVVVVPPLGDPVVDVVGLRVPGGALEDVLPVGASGVHELTVRLSPVGVAPGVHERGRTPTLDRTELWARRKSCTELRALMAGSMAHDRDKDPQANLIFVFSLSLSMTDRTRRVRFFGCGSVRGGNSQSWRAEDKWSQHHCHLRTGLWVLWIYLDRTGSASRSFCYQLLPELIQLPGHMAWVRFVARTGVDHNSPNASRSNRVIWPTSKYEPSIIVSSNRMFSRLSTNS